nr:facilitated trehalose transporter Tret1-like [Leptinotarsa decemlineata]
MHFGWSSPSIPLLTNGSYKIHIDGDEASWLAVTLLPGTIVGAIIAGKCAGLFGRKKVILMTSLPLLLGWILIAVANEVAVLHVARFIAGISIGLSFTVIPMYLGEIAEPQIRGVLSSFCPLCIVFGILLINVLGNYLPINITAMISCIFPVILFVTFVGMPESPYFLFENGRFEEAKETLRILRGEDEADKELEKIRQNVFEESENMSIFKYFFLDKVNRKAALVAYGLRTIQQFCGTTAITFYCKTIFEEEQPILSASLSTNLYFFIQLCVAFFTIFVVDISGRKPLLLISLVGCSVTLLMMGAYLFVKNKLDIDWNFASFVPLVVLYLNVVFLGIGVRNIPILMMGELFSPRVKPFASCIGTIYFSLLSMVSAKMFYIINIKFGMYMSFWIYGFLSLISIVFVIFVVPETKGLRLEDIQLRLGKRCRTEDIIL